MNRSLSPVLAFLLMMSAGCQKPGSPGVADAAPAASNSAEPAASTPPAPLSPGDAFDAYVDALGKQAEAGQYADVCKGVPWFPAPICQWVAARAEGKAVGRPDSELYRSLFYKEHWAHAYGTIVGESGDSGDYEASVSGYHNRVIVDTVDTKYESDGHFNLWVQEQPDTREVTLKSGTSANWVVLAEMPLAKALMDLAHSGVSVESTAIAKDAMANIARYHPYRVLKGDIPPLPGAAAASPSPATSGGTPGAHATAGTTATTTTPAAPAGTPAATPDMAACCAALDQVAAGASDVQRGVYVALIAACRMNDPGSAAGRKNQLRQNAIMMKLPPLPAACQ